MKPWIKGISVIGIDKTSPGVASTAKQRWRIFYAGGGTPIQKEAGVLKILLENMFNYLIQETGDIVKQIYPKKIL